MKYVLVTGAFGGMGKSVTNALVRRGFGVFALDKRITEAGENVIPIECDVTDEESVKNAAAVVGGITDELYAVLHFAGVYMLDSLADMETADFERIMRINFFGAFLVNKAFIPYLKSGGRIIMTTSELATLDPLPFTGIYAVSKAALDKYAYSLDMEVQLLGIKVSVIRAGAVDTGMLGASTDALEKFCEKTKLYQCNAARFRHIVDSVEAKSVSPDKIAEKVTCILDRKNPAFAYSINRNPLLCLLNILPKRMQLFAIRCVLR